MPRAQVAHQHLEFERTHARTKLGNLLTRAYGEVKDTRYCTYASKSMQITGCPDCTYVCILLLHNQRHVHWSCVLLVLVKPGFYSLISVATVRFWPAPDLMVEPCWHELTTRLVTS